MSIWVSIPNQGPMQYEIYSSIEHGNVICVLDVNRERIPDRSPWKCKWMAKSSDFHSWDNGVFFKLSIIISQPLIVRHIILSVVVFSPRVTLRFRSITIYSIHRIFIPNLQACHVQRWQLLIFRSVSKISRLRWPCNEK